MEIVTIETPTLGDRSYVAIHDGVALVVDPQRDIDRVLDVLAEHGDPTVSHVLETHIHNDYVTGGHALAELTGATYVVNAADEVSFDRHGVSDGDRLTAGDMTVRVLATPGHTFTHLAYVVDVDGQPPALFSGGSLLYGSTGRPDLLGPDHTDALVRHQWDSARRLADELPAETALLPTHGFGSFCAASQAEGTSGTIADEQAINPVLTDDRDAFVADTLAGLGAWPAYYVHMAPTNADGPDRPDLSPLQPADPAELRRRIDAGEWVVDLRSRTAYAPGHVTGTVNIGLDGSFVTYVGWLKPRGAPITLLGTADEVAEAQRELVRIGIERPAAAGIGTVDDWAGGRELADYPIVDFADLAEALDGADRPQVLDVRRTDERVVSHVPGSQHVPIHELPHRLDEVPTDGTTWVHCGAGYRAAIAASLLDATGRDVVLIDDEFDRAVDLGLVTSSDR
ncbi:MBL fold metallo-hydrolase [Salsipaludibacter albus]|uniref:MBL fold metallo-hydrolase n=1 Tax=Salsipaludibacter albus TaxID=2849650 RepID=UPI001EE3F2FD|nr:MBL fold metallo-hydrolase [Salsipaludibacter albus]MBY5163104.1 MBL fold metallo-hydrolase [Salsipaludibacter albus]